MSIRTIDRVLLESRTTSPIEQLVLIIIANYAQDDGSRAYPSMTTIAKRARLPVRSVRRAIRGLEQCGDLAVEFGGGRSGSNRYRVLLPPDGVSGEDGASGGDRVSGGARTVCPGGEDGASPDPSLIRQSNRTGTLIALASRQKAPRKGTFDGLRTAGGFDAFWAVYPRRRAKGDARKAWKALKPSPELQQKILNAVSAQSQSPDWQKEEGKYIPYPASWLRGERWEDEPETGAATGESDVEQTDRYLAELRGGR